jgi:hypothetical protein
MIKSYRLILYLFTFSIFLYKGCIDLPEEIILPEWDVDLNIPIINKHYTLNDIITSPQYISVEPSESDNIYLIQSDKYSGTSQIGKFIRLSNGFSLVHQIIFAASTDSASLYLMFPSGVEIDSARFLGGAISINIDNPSNEPVSASINFPGILKPDGDEVFIIINVPANTINNAVYNLEGHTYKLPQNQQVINKNSLQIIPKITTPSSGGNFVFVDLNTTDFLFESVYGKMPKTFLGSQKIPLNINFGKAVDFRDKVFLKEAVFNLKTKIQPANTSPFEMGFYNLQIIGKRNNGNEKILSYLDGSGINLEVLAGENNITFSETNSNLNEFISFFPDSLFISADYYLNPQNSLNTHSASIADSVKFETDFTTRSILALKKSNLVDTVLIDISEDSRDVIEKGTSADLTIEVENAIPFTTFLKIILTDASYNPILTLTQNSAGTDSLQFSGGQVDISTGEVTLPSSNSIKTNLNNEQIKKMVKAVYAIVSTTVRTQNADDEINNPPFVNIKSTDWIKIRCYGKINYLIDPEEK